MKKVILSLLVLMVALVITAAPGNNIKKGMAKTMPFKRELMAKPDFANKLRKAPKKATEITDTVNIRITGNYTFYLDVDEEEETSDWFFSGKDETGMYTVRLDWPGGEADKYGTFTNKELDKDFSYIKDMTTGELEYRNYEDGTSVTVSDNNGMLHIEGTLVCDNGVVYNLWMEHAPQTYNIEGTDLTEIYYFEEDADWYMRFNDDNFRVSLDLITGAESEFTGIYDESDMIAGYTFVTDLVTECTDYVSKLNVKLSLPHGINDPARACEITGTALTEHGDTYNFHMVKNPPITPVKTVNVNVSVKSFDWPSKSEDYKGYFEVTEVDSAGMPTDNQWTFAVDALTDYIFTSGIIDTLTYRTNTSTGETLAFDNGTVIITPVLADSASQLSLDVQAALVMKDSIEYCFSFNAPIKVKGTVDFSFDNLSLNNTYYSDTGLQWINASNDKATLEMTLTNAEVPGVYSNTNASIAMAVTDADGEKSAVTSIAIFNASTTLDEHNQPVLTAKFLGNNKRIYNIYAYYEIPAVKDTLNVSVEGLKAYDYLSLLGAFQIYGYNSDSTVYLALAPVATQFAGHYTAEDLAAFRNYSFLAFRQADGSYEKNDFYSADFDVTQDGKVLTVVGKFIAGAHFVNLTIKATIRQKGMEYDCEDADLDVEFTKDDLNTLEKGDGYAYVLLENKKRSDIFSMVIYLNKFDDDIVVPAGTYNVSDTYLAPSVQPGQLYDTNLYPSFYATIGENEYLYEPFWFLRAGTVTFTKNADKTMSFEVNGTNSFGRKMHVLYNNQVDGINAISTNASSSTTVRKVIENNRLVIKKGNSTFSLGGQRL